MRVRILLVLTVVAVAAAVLVCRRTAVVKPSAEPGTWHPAPPRL